MSIPATAADKRQSFARSAVWLFGCVTVVALLLLPAALSREGSGSLVGLLLAAGICWTASLASEAFSCFVLPPGAPLAGLVLGMGARLLPPLVVCCMLALTGQNGHQNLAFVWYLLAFYMVTLAVDTTLAVKRLAAEPSPSHPMMS